MGEDQRMAFISSGSLGNGLVAIAKEIERIEIDPAAKAAEELPMELARVMLWWIRI
jgi:hypothetical protein